MPVLLEARFENRRAADAAVSAMRRSGLFFDVMDVRTSRGGGLTASADGLPEATMYAQPPSPAFDHVCAKMFMVTEAEKSLAAGFNAAVLRLKINESSLGRAAEMLRSAGAWGVRSGQGGVS